MSFPVYQTSGTISIEQYNDIFYAINDVIGPGENGYGLQDFFMSPVSSRELITAKHIDNLKTDVVRIAYKHITSSTNTLTDAITAGGPLEVEADFMNRAWDAVQYVDTNRYTCHENNYYVDPTTGETINTTGGVSTRTSEWGINENTITHTVASQWGSRLLARYFFNAGGYFTWTPYHSNNGLNDIDAEWTDFIVTIRNDQLVNELRYDRSDFVNQVPGSTTRIYPTGSSRTYPDHTYDNGANLYVDVDVTKATNEESIEVTVTFGNSDSANLIVTPTVGYWNTTV